MAVSLDISGVLVDSIELEEKRASIEVAIRAAENLQKFRSTNSDDATVDFSSGRVDFNTLLTDLRNEHRSSSLSALQKGPPVEFGKPLHVEIIGGYTGNSGSHRGRDLLVASAVKDVASHEAMPKAVNLLKKNVGDISAFQPGAFDAGSPTVYYSPALDVTSLMIGVDVALERFDDGLFQFFDKLLRVSAGIPIFAPASVWLLAGSQVVRIAASLARTLTAPNIVLRSSYSIRLDDIWYSVPVSGLAALWPDSIDAVERKTIEDKFTIVVGDGGRNVYLGNRSTGEPYSGKVPYVLINLNTTEKPELVGFKPQHATASILELFYGAEDAGPAIIDVLREALTLYSDMTYRKKAIAVQGELKSLETSGGDKEVIAELRSRFQTNLKNIVHPEIRETLEEIPRMGD